jgi:adenosylmethionine-8-amino-7-oxononanoate transaminase
MQRFAELDHRYVWHPFTQMRDWLQHEPIVISGGKGAILRDTRGREYLDANASIWTNLHGHNHPKLNAAIRKQLGMIAHSSALGLANEPASLLGQQLVRAANPPSARAKSDGKPFLNKVFFSDNGSTAMEVALKLAYEFARRTGRSDRPRFLSLKGAYHGDTIGAVSLGHNELFHKSYRGLLFKTDEVMAPYCYRCRFNRARPERADAREYRKCRWECLDQVSQRFERKKTKPYAGFVFEPLMQGAAGMIAQPKSWLSQACRIARSHGALLIADEVMTGFGRTGMHSAHGDGQRLFATQAEEVVPDFLALAKGLTGGYLPMAATLTTQRVFDAFLGEYREFKTFFHGHSFTGNQIGAASALASLQILQTSGSQRARKRLERILRDELQTLWTLPSVGDIRQVGLVAGIELVRNWQTRAAFDLEERVGIRVCEKMAERGVLTRPIGDVLVLMPPYCATKNQITRMVGVMREAINEIQR